MSGIYYAAVEGDPLTSGEGSHVYAKEKVGTIVDETGRPRRMVFIGDHAYCSKCGSTGLITYGAGVSERKRMIDLVNGGRRQAVGGDLVLCKCADPPRIIAVYGRKWMIHDRGDETHAPVAKAPAQSLPYDEQFTLTDAAGKALADTSYTVRMPSGELRHGVTDSQGRTERYKTKGAQSIRIYLGHRQES